MNDEILEAVSKHRDEIERLLDQLGYVLKDVVLLVGVNEDELLWRVYFREEDQVILLAEEHHMGEGSSLDKALRASVADLRDRLDEEDEDEDDEEEEDDDDDE